MGFFAGTDVGGAIRDLRIAQESADLRMFKTLTTQSKEDTP